MHELTWLEERIGYAFEEPELLRRALIHPSAEGIKGVTREDAAFAQRLSWLGDSILDMVVSDKLYTLFPTATRDELHHWCVRLTNNRALGKVGVELELRKAMIIGKSLVKDFEATDRPIMFAGALEALLGAIYVDGGIQKARAAIRRILAGDFKKLLEHLEEPKA